MAELMETMTAPENLLGAWRAVRGNVPRGRRLHSAGPDGVTLAEFERDLNTQLDTLRDMLNHERYEPAPPKVVKIPKSQGGHRAIGVLNVRDRVAQRAAAQSLAPLWESDFLECSFGFRPGRGVPNAMAYARSLWESGHRWVVESDIEDCFGSLDHDLLLKRVSHRVHDGRVVRLVTRWLDCGALSAGLPASPDEAEEANSNGKHKVAGDARRALLWLADGMLPGLAGPTYLPAPRGARNHEGNGQAGTLEDADFEALAQEDSLRRMVVTALAAGVAWMRPNIGQGLYRMRQVAASPAGRRMLKSGSWVVVGLAGAAAVGAVSALAINRFAGPAPTGVVQGSPLSPLMANIYLHPFDAWMVKREHKLVRYADDFVALAESEERAEIAFNDTIHAMRNLHLKVNRQKTRIVKPGDRWEFLGQSF